MKIYNFPQYSPEWWAIRDRKMTGSHAQAIGSCGAGLETYVKEIIRLYHYPEQRENYTNKHLERGLALEDSAGLAYSCDKNISVQKVGFVAVGSYAGCSPDLFANDDGLCEIKCLDNKNHFDLILGAKTESKYLWQCQMEMLICGKLWCDLTYYNPNFKEYLLVYRQTPNAEKIEKLKKGLLKGKLLMDEIEKKLQG